MINKGPGHLQGHMMNMASVTNMLAALLGRPVMDHTGLKGYYDFDLEYTPDEGQRMPPGGAIQAPSASSADADGVSLLNAVQSQLGLKLEAQKGPMELIVVDHIEKSPTEN